MKNLTTLSATQFEDFFQSFDLILCDVHGVLLNVLCHIPGAPEAVRTLQNFKKFAVVSNNTSCCLQDYSKELKTAGFDVDQEDIITPIQTTISFLQEINFDKKIFILGPAAVRKSVEDAGFKVAPRGPPHIDDSLQALADAATEDDVRVGAVLSDMDNNASLVNLQRCITYLKRPEVLFLKGAPDFRFSMGDGKVVIGPGHWQRILEEMSGRKATSVAKPGRCMHEYVAKKYEVRKSKRVLFIGDSIPADMAFASQFGYQKLLVLSGVTTMENVLNWQHPEEHKPDYFVKSLKEFHEIILQFS